MNPMNASRGRSPSYESYESLPRQGADAQLAWGIAAIAVSAALAGLLIHFLDLLAHEPPRAIPDAYWALAAAPFRNGTALARFCLRVFPALDLFSSAVRAAAAPTQDCASAPLPCALRSISHHCLLILGPLPTAAHDCLLILGPNSTPSQVAIDIGISTCEAAVEMPISIVEPCVEVLRPQTARTLVNACAPVAIRLGDDEQLHLVGAAAPLNVVVAQPTSVLLQTSHPSGACIAPTASVRPLILSYGEYDAACTVVIRQLAATHVARAWRRRPAAQRAAARPATNTRVAKLAAVHASSVAMLSSSFERLGLPGAGTASGSEAAGLRDSEPACLRAACGTVSATAPRAASTRFFLAAAAAAAMRRPPPAASARARSARRRLVRRAGTWSR